MHDLDFDLRSHVSRRSLVAAGLFLIAVAAVATSTHRFGAAVNGLEKARPVWLWAAAAAFLGSLLVSASAWRGAFGLCGAELTRLDASARYGLGSLVNSLTPVRAGGAVRFALFGSALPGGDRAWRAGGALAVITAGRAVVFGVLVVCAAALGAVPLWPVVVFAGFAGVCGLVAFATRDRTPRTHVAHVLDAFRGLARSPLGGARIVCWLAAGTAARCAGAIAIAAALGVRSPVSAALIIVPALDLAGLIPLSGSVGITSGAVAVALETHGIGMTQGLATGLAFHAVETAAGITFGLASALVLAPRRRVLTLAAAGAAACLAAAFAATVLVPLA